MAAFGSFSKPLGRLGQETFLKTLTATPSRTPSGRQPEAHGHHYRHPADQPPPGWYRGRGGQSVAVTTDERVIQVGGSLYLRSAQLEDSGRYTCVVNNSVGSERASTSLLVTKQLSAYMSPQVQVVDVGKTALFNCTTDGHPKQSVVWLKDAQLLTPSSRVRLLASETLKIVHVERSDRGMYQCVVSNAEETAQGTAQLKLGDAAPVLLRTFANATLAPGSAWSAQCEASGSPAPAVSWALDGAPLESSPGGERVAVSNRVTADGVLSYLNVSALAPEHGGRYACSATNAVGSVTHQAYLYVLGPPYIKPMQDRRVVAGTTVTFNCYVTGYPISSIYWEKDGRPLTDTHRQTLFPNGTLLINDVRKMDDEGGYVCVARNPDGDTARRKLNVQVMEAPEIDPIMVKPNLQRGMRIHLTCIISKGDFPVAIHWLKDGKAVPHGQSITEKTIDDYSSTLSFNGLVVKHSGNYTCQASNAAAVTNYTVSVVVNVPPTWRHEPNDTEVVLGSSLMVDCAADGSPLPSILWRKESPVPRSPFQNIQRAENFKVLENGSLWIQHVLLEDKGYYVCEASSGIGLGLSKGIYITVHVPARFSSEFRNVTAKKDSTAILDCVAEGDKPLKVQWIQANRLVQPNHVKLDIKEEHLDFGLRSKMTIKHVQRDDTAT
ncbi:Down syndrome cell adhesion molecule-like protein Dscam2 [Schistocerca nitens]|uniref:Down syndrome cell adhesion molecule-like protein Dscam2 n=1 Tax=Schistocerca nitens TaxID=7011 RepID=UPI0021195709|nr:Down syndrome cell adhesion molecule-like protein Dscam2 [Schistocerca nitens]